MKISLWALLLAFSSTTFADFKFEDLTPDDIDKISTEFAGNFLFSEVSPAQSLGDIWGFEVGIIGGLTDSPEVQRVVRTADPTQDISSIPHGYLFGALTVPYGITAQVGLIPTIDASDAEISLFAAAVKWTVTDIFFTWLPIDVAVRGHYSSGEFSFSQIVNNPSTGNQNVNATISLENTVMGADISASYDILIFEPYIGFGFASGDTDIDVEGSATVSIFSQTSTLSGLQSVSADDSSGRFFMGLQLDLWLAHISAEYGRAFGNDRYSAKFSFYF